MMPPPICFVSSLPKPPSTSATLPLACLASGREEQSHYLPMVHCPDFVTLREQFPNAIILHYMDDLLICAKDSTY